MAKQVEYPADTVDISGKVWDTVGENIRHGLKDNLENALIKFRHDTLDAMFPVGYIFIGQLPEILKTEFTWNPGAGLINRTIGTSIFKPENLNASPLFSSSTTVPTLTKSELNTFNNATGLDLKQGTIAVPVYKRIK